MDHDDGRAGTGWGNGVRAVMKICHKAVKTVMTKSKLPASDYAVNPYVGCPHKCAYCYASFMKRFTGHEEPWGDFIDVKEFPPIKKPERYVGKRLFVGSVTDGYNPYEKQFEKTKEILQQFVGLDVDITISTKSGLVVRDVALLKQLEHVLVAFSINTLDEGFRADMDHASPIADRIAAMRVLHENGIDTATFISPIFPEITVVEDIVRATKDVCGAFWLENLNLRGGYKRRILDYVEERYPQHLPLYQDIYQKGDRSYWVTLSKRLADYAKDNGVNMVNYFYHEEIRSD